MQTAICEQTTVLNNAVEEEVETECDFVLIEELAEHGVNQADITKLKDEGMNTIGTVLCQTRKALLGIRGFSDAKVDKLLTLCRKLDKSSVGMFRTGLQLMEARDKVIKISTGSKAFDSILGGGIETGSITEFFGEFRTGKTQLCHTLCVISQLSRELGGAEGRAVYIDTEGNFRPERIKAIAERFALCPDDTLDNILVARVHTHEQQMDMYKQVAGLCASEGPIHVCIVDSIMAKFRTEFCGRGELSERQQKLGRHMCQLTQLAEEFNMAVVICNQVMSDPGAMSMFVTVKPAGGHVLAHASTTRVHLKKGKGEERIAKIFDSPSVPEAEAGFQITEGGIKDVS